MHSLLPCWQLQWRILREGQMMHLAKSWNLAKIVRNSNYIHFWSLVILDGTFELQSLTSCQDFYYNRRIVLDCSKSLHPPLISCAHIISYVLKMLHINPPQSSIDIANFRQSQIPAVHKMPWMYVNSPRQTSLLLTVHIGNCAELHRHRPPESEVPPPVLIEVRSILACHVESYSTIQYRLQKLLAVINSYSIQLYEHHHLPWCHGYLSGLLIFWWQIRILSQAWLGIVLEIF